MRRKPLGGGSDARRNAGKSMAALALAAAASAAVWCGGAPASAQGDGGSAVAAGEHLALTVCAVCHVVSPSQSSPPVLDQRTPSFRRIANRPGTTPESLRKFLETTHWDENTLPASMPNLKLMDYQKDELVAYIMSLRKRR